MSMINLARLRNAKTLRHSSYDVGGRNADSWQIPAGQSRVLADIRGPGVITHIWMTQGANYRECLIKITWDDAPTPSVLCPLGDFFCLGHGMVNSFQSLFFTASAPASRHHKFGGGCALNAYVPMPFRRRAVVELVNESAVAHNQYFYIDYEQIAEKDLQDLGYFHAEFRRTNPFGGWGHEIEVNTPQANIANMERLAWDNNYVILETKGRGHYLGCNLSVSNFQGTWWGEGDDMIWVDGYKWPPDLHGTGSEDFLNQAWGMQPNAFLRNGSSIFEGDTLQTKDVNPWSGKEGGYQTSYVFHPENPVHFQKEIKVTIEHGHGNHLANEMSSVAYWYAQEPSRIAAPPPVAQRMPVQKVKGKWILDVKNQCPGEPVQMNDEIKAMKTEWSRLAKWHAVSSMKWMTSRLFPAGDIAKAPYMSLTDRKAKWKKFKNDVLAPGFVNVMGTYGKADGIAYTGGRFKVKKAGTWTLHIGHGLWNDLSEPEGGVCVFIDGKRKLCELTRATPSRHTRSQVTLSLSKGVHEIVVALDTDHGKGWGFHLAFEMS